jgi:hypothetical protein
LKQRAPRRRLAVFSIKVFDDCAYDRFIGICVNERLEPAGANSEQNLALEHQIEGCLLVGFGASSAAVSLQPFSCSIHSLSEVDDIIPDPAAYDGLKFTSHP